MTVPARMTVVPTDTNPDATPSRTSPVPNKKSDALPISELLPRVALKCLDKSNYSAWNPPYFLPSEGTWRFSFFLEDAGKNQSAPVSYDILIVNDSLLTSIRDKTRTIILLMRDTIQQSLLEATQVLDDFKKLSTQYEKALVRSDVTRALIASGSVDLAQEQIRLKNGIKDAKISESGDEIWIVTDSKELLRISLKDMETKSTIQFPKQPQFIATKHRILILFERSE